MTLEATIRAQRILHARGTYPDAWSTTVGGVSEQTTDEEVSALLDKTPASPPGVRTTGHGRHAYLYGGKRRSEPTIRLFDTLVVGDSGDIHPKNLKAALADPFAAGVDGISLDSAKAAKVLVEALANASTPAIRRLELGAPPSEEHLGQLLRHPKLAALTHLRVGGNGTTLGDARVALVAAMPARATIRLLHLCGTDKLGEKTYGALGSAPFDSLDSFVMSSSSWVARKTVRAQLFRADWLKRLRVLSITDLTADDVTALEQSVDFENLLALRTNMRGGNEPEPPDRLFPVLSRLRSCQAFGYHSAAPVPGLVAALSASGCVRRLDELSVPSSDYEEAVASGFVRDGVKVAYSSAGFWWRWMI